MIVAALARSSQPRGLLAGCGYSRGQVMFESRTLEPASRSAVEGGCPIASIVISANDRAPQATA